MKDNIARQTWESMCGLAGEYITKKRYALAIGLVFGGLTGWLWF